MIFLNQNAKYKNKELNYIHTHNTGDSVPYRINNLGFRGRDWEDGEEGHILCVGDSLTFGVGIPQIETWPEKLSRDIGVQYHNLSCYDWSNDHIWFNTMQYLRRGWGWKPVAIFVLWTIFDRRFHFQSDKDIMHLAVHSGKGNQSPIHKSITDAYLYVNNDENNSVNFSKSYYSLKDYCELEGIDFYCAGVVEQPKNWFGIEMKGFREEYELNKGGAKDGVHPGREFHQNISDFFSTQIIDNQSLG